MNRPTVSKLVGIFFIISPVVVVLSLVLKSIGLLVLWIIVLLCIMLVALGYMFYHFDD